jgi:cell division protein ZapA
MPNSEIDLAVVNIMGREFKIKCPKDKVHELQEAALYLNGKMQEVQHGDKFITIDRVAITAALNIAHELMLEKQHLQTHSSDHRVLNKRLFVLRQKLSQALES